MGLIFTRLICRVPWSIIRIINKSIWTFSRDWRFSHEFPIVKKHWSLLWQEKIQKLLDFCHFEFLGLHHIQVEDPLLQLLQRCAQIVGAFKGTVSEDQNWAKREVIKGFGSRDEYLFWRFIKLNQYFLYMRKLCFIRLGWCAKEEKKLNFCFLV